jgi:rod shape determining protein RodA
MLATFMALGLLHSINAQARETGDRKGRASIFQ